MTFELALPDGGILRTRVPHPVDRTDHGPRMWSHILRDQLQVDEATFWACVRDGVKPGRGLPVVSAEALPAELVSLLIVKVGLGEAEVMTMTKAEAIARLQRFWTEGG